MNGRSFVDAAQQCPGALKLSVPLETTVVNEVCFCAGEGICRVAQQQ